MSTTQQVQTSLRESPKARWTALILLASAMFFSYIFMDILSPLKDLIAVYKRMGFNSLRYICRL